MTGTPYRTITLAALIAMACSITCKPREEQLDTAYPAPVVTQVAPLPATPPAAPGTGPAMPAALGFGCGTDADPQCPFARCLGGRCGGCTDGSECKPGSACFPTWFGRACLPSQSPPPAVATMPPTAAPPVAPATPTSTNPTTRARELCVARINEYRGRVGVAPLGRRTDRETCADAQSRSDGATGSIHGAFGQCGEQAQNECPGWSGSLETIVDRCLAMMFAEGPGQGSAHGHYNNMTDRRAVSVACGIGTGSDGKIWMVQDFYR